VAIAKTENRLSHLQRIKQVSSESQTGVSEYVITGADNFLKPVFNAEVEFKKEITALRKLVEGNSLESISVDSLSKSITKHIEFSQQLIYKKRNKGILEAAKMMESGQGKAYIDNIKEWCNVIEKNEIANLASSKQSNQQSLSQLNTIQRIVLCVVFIIALILIYQVKYQFAFAQKNLEKISVLNKLIDQTNDSIYIVDADRKIISWNKGAQHLYGYNENEAIGIDSFTLLKTEYSNTDLNSVINEVGKNNFWSGEVKRKTKNGQSIYVRSSLYSIKDDKGKIINYFAVSFDVTEGKKLREQVAYLASLVEQSSEAIISRDLDKRIISWNKGAKDLFGFTKEEAIGKTPQELGFIRFSDEEILTIETEVKNNNNFNTERLLHRKSGEQFWAAITASVVKNDKQEPIAIVFVIKDFSIKRQLEDYLKKTNADLEKKVEERAALVLKNEVRFQSLIEHGAEGIILATNNKTITYKSTSANKLVGEDCSKNFLSLVHHSYLNEVVGAFDKAEQSPESPIPFQVKLLHASGHYFWAQGTISNLTHLEEVGAFVINFYDITTRKLAEEKLQSSEERYRTALDNMMEGVQIVGFDWKYIYVNDAVAKQGKYSREQLVGHTMMELYPGIEHTHLYQLLENCFKHREQIHMINEFEYPDKSKGWFELSIQPVPEGVFILSIDITDRKRTEMLAAQSEQDMKAIFENASEGFLLLDVEGKVKTFNDRIANNLPFEVAKGMHIGASLFDFVEPHRKEFVQQILEKVKAGQSIQYDRSYSLKNNKTVWYNFSFTPVLGNNKEVHGFCITGANVTQKKISEQLKEFESNNLHALINNTNDLIWSIDKEFKLITFNEAFSKSIRLSAGVWPEKGKSILLVNYPGEVVDRFKQYYERAFRGDVFREIEYITFPSEAWLEISFYPIYESGSVVGTACFSRDITQVKRAEAELNKNLQEKKMMAERMLAIINALPANIALINNKGIIIEVNESWKNFAHSNGFIGADYGIGDDYLAYCHEENADGQSHEGAVCAGIKAVLKKQVNMFEYEYPCHSPTTKRWFRMVVNSLNTFANEGAVITHIDITEIRRLEEERLVATIREQKKVAKAVLQGQEKERHAIGTELHDNVNQVLVGANMMLAMAKRKPENAGNMIDIAMTSIYNAINENRKIAHVFVSPNFKTETVSDKIILLATNLFEPAGIKVLVEVTDLNEALLGEEKKINIYRIAQEQCANIIKYAKATRVDIKMTTNISGWFTMHIADNGEGTVSTNRGKGIGLKNIQGRLSLYNGNLSINTSPGNGFELEINIPLEEA
jgi:PAS domain S-box-containing protein